MLASDVGLGRGLALRDGAIRMYSNARRRGVAVQKPK